MHDVLPLANSLHRSDVQRAVEGDELAAYATFQTLLDARVGWFLGPCLAGGKANRATVARWADTEGTQQ